MQDYFDLANNLESGVSNAVQQTTSRIILNDAIRYRENLCQEIRMNDCSLLKVMLDVQYWSALAIAFFKEWNTEKYSASASHVKRGQKAELDGTCSL